MKFGGLGIRRVSDLALPSFLASVASTMQTQEYLLSRCSSMPADMHSHTLTTHWQTTTGLEAPQAPNSFSQSAWDNPLVTASLSGLIESSPNQTEKARVLAAAAPHSGDWLHALPIAACGLRLDDNALRVAVGYRLGTRICEPHTCPCGTDIDGLGSHALSCKKSAGKTLRHTYINDVIFRALSCAGVPSTKEPAGLSRSDGKRPDGITQIPWSSGKSAVWDVTVADTLAQSYVSSTAQTPGSAAENAAMKKENKYTALATHHLFVPLAFESLGPLCKKATTFLQEIGKRSSALHDDPRETSFLFQRVSVAIQRFNAVLLSNSFAAPTDTDLF